MSSKKAGRGPRRAVKGFRPGKEPAQLKKQRAVADLGKDASWMQKQAVGAVAGQSGAQVRAMVRRWSIGLGIGGLTLALGGVFLYSWNVVAGIVIHVFAAVLFFLAYRIRRQAPGLEQMADSLR